MSVPDEEVVNVPWIKLSTALLSQLRRLKGAKALVWLAIALRINEKLVSFPSISKICQDTGYSNREVIDTLKELARQGFLTIQRGEHKFNIYRINHYAVIGNAVPTIPASEETSPVNLPATPVNLLPTSVNFLPAPVKLDAQNMLETSLKQESINKTVKPDDRYSGHPDFPKVWAELERLCGAISRPSSLLIDIWLEKHKLEHILQAIEVTRAKGADSPEYVNRVLISWERNGYPPTREEMVRTRAFRPSRAAKRANDTYTALKNYIKEQQNVGQSRDRDVAFTLFDTTKLLDK